MKCVKRTKTREKRKQRHEKIIFSAFPELPPLLMGPPGFYSIEIDKELMVSIEPKHAYSVKPIGVIMEIPCNAIIELVYSESISGLKKMLGYTALYPDIIFKHPEKVIYPRPLGLKPPPWRKLVKPKQNLRGVYLHLIIDQSGSMPNLDIEKIAAMARGYARNMSYLTGMRYEYVILKDLEEYVSDEIKELIGHINIENRNIRVGSYFSNYPFKIYTFSELGFESVEFDATYVTPYMGESTNPIGALILLYKNLIYTVEGGLIKNEASIWFRTNVNKADVKGSLPLRRHFLIFISDYMFVEYKTPAFLLAAAINSGLLDGALFISLGEENDFRKFSNTLMKLIKDKDRVLLVHNRTPEIERYVRVEVVKLIKQKVLKKKKHLLSINLDVEHSLRHSVDYFRILVKGYINKVRDAVRVSIW